MIDGKANQVMEQGSAFLAEWLPPLWRGLYEGSKREGFSEDEAMDLLKAYIISQGSGDKKVGK